MCITSRLTCNITGDQMDKPQADGEVTEHLEGRARHEWSLGIRWGLESRTHRL